TQGKTALEALGQLMTSVGGNAFWLHSTSQVVVILPDLMHPTGTIATLDVQNDLDEGNSPLQASRDVDSNPTPVTVTAPTGSVTLIDTAAEATGLRRDDSYDSACPDLGAASALAGARLNRQTSTRFTQFGIDLVNSSQDVWNAMLTNLRPGARITLNGLP